MALNVDWSIKLKFNCMKIFIVLQDSLGMAEFKFYQQINILLGIMKVRTNSIFYAAIVF